jgi:hypothetical protein
MKKLLKRIPFPVALMKRLKAKMLGFAYLGELRDIVVGYQALSLKLAHPNPLSRHGMKCFSQTDEDGITLEILRRIKSLDSGTFAEFGVGNGTENNTLILKALGWKGFWVGGEKLAYTTRQSIETFSYRRAWIARDNIVGLAEEGRRNLKSQSVDVISLDLDGNDIYLVEKLLENGFHPKLFIVEYNAKFPPPVRWQMDYDATHRWHGDDYFGASLCSFVDLFSRFGFFLACCNAHSGANAFFLREEFRGAFADIPRDLNEIYVPPRYYLYNTYGHPRSVRTIEQMFS